MQPQFWLDKWQQGQIGFHQTRVNPLMLQHWPTIQLPAGSEVLVPLAGKSLDMPWLAGQGHRVTGVELSDDACAAFFAENGLIPTVDTFGPFRRRRHNNITLLAGDIFDCPPAAFAETFAVYDRAALIALPDTLRRRYVDSVYRRLPVGSQALLITLEYDQTQMVGPPFCVDADAVQTLFADICDIARLDQRDILSDEPHMAERGLTQLRTTVWHLTRRQEVA